MKRRILILANSIGGLHSFRKEVVSAIRDAGYDVTIAVPDDTDKRIAFFKSEGCHIERIRFSRRGTNPIADLLLMIKYCWLIARTRPLAVLTYTIKPNIYGGIAARLCHVSQLANITGLGDAVENGGWLQKLTLALYKIGLKKANTIFFQNRENMDYFRNRGILGEKSVLLPGSGVNLNYHVFQPYPANDGTTRFLYIGRLLKDKGIRELFTAAKLVKATYPNTEFRIIGSVEGPFQRQLDELIQLGIINYLGVTTDVRPFIGDVECTVMPSYHEGMSNANLESAANGRPVITTRVSGCRETVEEGKTGYLVEARNVNMLVEAMERFIILSYDEKVMMGKKARRKVEMEFDRQIVVQSYLQTIREIMK